MNRTLSNLTPALLLALSMLVATGLAAAAPQASWAAAAGPLLLVFAMVGADLFQRRRQGHRLPSLSTLLVAVAMLAAFGIVASGGFDRLAGFIPILGGGVALPVILQRDGGGVSCPRAARKTPA